MISRMKSAYLFGAACVVGLSLVVDMIAREIRR